MTTEEPPSSPPAAPPSSPPANPQARLRELLAIPERLRTDAQWDEIIEIEISMGPKKLPGNPSKPASQAPSRQPSERKPSVPGKHMRKRRT
ncbi:MAG: hypothetical protein NTY41_17190 [Proteobacteria bacterium]|nr:hypothetical protein [Pseudomonadota bacterium]